MTEEVFTVQSTPSTLTMASGVSAGNVVITKDYFDYDTLKSKDKDITEMTTEEFNYNFGSIEVYPEVNPGIVKWLGTLKKSINDLTERVEFLEKEAEKNFGKIKANTRLLN